MDLQNTSQDDQELEFEYEEIEEDIPEIQNKVLKDDIQKQNKKLEDKLPDSSRKMETDFEVNKLRTEDPNSEIILDLQGEKARVGDDENSELDTEYRSIQEIVFGENTNSNSPVDPSVFLIIVAVVVGMIVLVAFNIKRSDHFNKLEKDIDDIKKGKISRL